MCDLGRVQKELKEIERDTASGVTVSIVGDSLQHLTGVLAGPSDTP
jgi:ubiquitin-conjugating enzyme (huntingtin interacting protein 2)